ncbi:hypothetical protein [Arthrobacter castelli]|uniref:hypothetical protein n=1 Tax=Arthrobacter castelli TaxID=271431 RepID=UPI0004135A10|nr:hypothetical protein [Arthrobacter castelli]
MTATHTAAKTLADLTVGDQVTVKRNLNHSHWMVVVDNPREGSRRVPNPDPDEVIGTAAIIDRRDVPAVPGWCGRSATTLVRLPNHHWYDLADGLQNGSRATRIEPSVRL